MRKPYIMDGTLPAVGAMDFSYLLDAPAGKHGFVQVKDGHLYFEDGLRAKFFGCDIAMNGCMPDKEKAEVDAERIAKSGLNIVRLHLADVPNIGNDISIIDPSCGCGIFLISAIEYISKKFSIPIPDVISNNIYGIDIIKKNVSRCRDVLLLLCLYNGYTNPPLKINIKVGDSLDLENSWTLDKKEFNYIIGNPPYINTHDMNYDTIQYLKTHYSTTRKGVFNIFYAFIERSLGYISNDGCIEFIVPNNFLTIKSAEYLRGMLQSNHCLLKLIDFANNMVFKPVRTYNCIVKLAKYNNMAPFEYCVLPNVSDIKNALSSIRFNSLDDSKLDINGWKLVDNVTLENINKIENQ